MPRNEQNPVTMEGAKLGRYLFYDTILSLDSSMACTSCHQQQYAFSDGPKRFSKGINGQRLKRNTLPLFNLAWYPSYFWDGRAETIEQQVLHPVRLENEMNLDWRLATKRIRNNDQYRQMFNAAFGEAPIDSTLITRAIGQFLRTLISYNSKYDSVLRGESYFTESEYQGFEAVNDQSMGNCFHCHETDAHALGTTGRFSNNGLTQASTANDYKDLGRGKVTGDTMDYGKFKIPTLRNIALTAPYMHDGRFKTLREVLEFYSEGVKQPYNIDSKMALAHRGGMQLTEEQKDNIIAFLHTLTDSSFTTNEQFSSPFE